MPDTDPDILAAWNFANQGVPEITQPETYHDPDVQQAWDTAGGGAPQVTEPMPWEEARAPALGIPGAPEISLNEPLIGGLTRAIRGAVEYDPNNPLSQPLPQGFPTSLGDVGALMGATVRAAAVPLNVINEIAEPAGGAIAAVGSYAGAGVRETLGMAPPGESERVRQQMQQQVQQEVQAGRLGTTRIAGQDIPDLVGALEVAGRQAPVEWQVASTLMNPVYWLAGDLGISDALSRAAAAAHYVPTGELSLFQRAVLGIPKGAEQLTEDQLFRQGAIPVLNRIPGIGKLFYEQPTSAARSILTNMVDNFGARMSAVTEGMDALSGLRNVDELINAFKAGKVSEYLPLTEGAFKSKVGQQITRVIQTFDTGDVMKSAKAAIALLRSPEIVAITPELLKSSGRTAQVAAQMGSELARTVKTISKGSALFDPLTAAIPKLQQIEVAVRQGQMLPVAAEAARMAIYAETEQHILTVVKTILYSKWTDHVGQAMVQTFKGIKYTKPVVKEALGGVPTVARGASFVKSNPTAIDNFFAGLKSLQSALVLGLNPYYAIRNAWNNYATMATRGVLGFWDDARVAGLIKDLGVSPVRFMQGFGAGGAKGFGFQALAARIESSASKTAWATGANKARMQLMQEGKGWALSDASRAALRQIDPSGTLERQVIQIIERNGMNKMETMARLRQMMSSPESAPFLLDFDQIIADLNPKYNNALTRERVAELWNEIAPFYDNVRTPSEMAAARVKAEEWINRQLADAERAAVRPTKGALKRAPEAPRAGEGLPAQKGVQKYAPGKPAAGREYMTTEEATQVGDWLRAQTRAAPAEDWLPKAVAARPISTVPQEIRDRVNAASKLASELGFTQGARAQRAWNKVVAIEKPNWNTMTWMWDFAAQHPDDFARWESYLNLTKQWRDSEPLARSAYLASKGVDVPAAKLAAKSVPDKYWGKWYGQAKQLAKVEAPTDDGMVVQRALDGMGIVFASPNVENLSLDQAITNLRGLRQRNFEAQALDLVNQYAPGAHVRAAIGSWADGAENSLGVTVRNIDDVTLDYLGARLGRAGYQKNILAFRAEASGGNFLYALEVPEQDLVLLSQRLQARGIEFSTLVPTETGTRVMVFDESGKLVDNVRALGGEYNVKRIEAYRGSGRFLGDSNWADRDAAAVEYNRIISDFESRRGLGAAPARPTVPVSAPGEPGVSAVGATSAAGKPATGAATGITDAAQATDNFAVKTAQTEAELLRDVMGAAGRHADFTKPVKAVMPRALIDDLNRTIFPAINDVKLASVKIGEFYRDASLLNYEHRYGMNAFASLVFPYEFFMTRSLVQWAEYFVDRPGMLALYLKMRDMLQNTLYDPQFPERMRGTIRIPLPFVPDWLGGGVFVNPLYALFPLEQIAQPLTGLRYTLAGDHDVAVRVRQMAANGEISQQDAEDAIKKQNGAIWDMARESVHALDANPYDVASLLSSPYVPLDWIWKIATGRPDEIRGLVPFAPAVQGATAMMRPYGVSAIPPEGINLDPVAWFKQKLFNAPYDPNQQYRVDRALASLVAQGEASEREAFLALIERQGEVYDRAVQYAATEQGVSDISALTGWRSKVVLPGEVQIRQEREQLTQLIDQLVQQAGSDPAKLQYDEKKALLKQQGTWQQVSEFYDQHPALITNIEKSREVEERLRDWYQSELWDSYYKLPALTRRQWRDQNPDADQKFIDKESRVDVNNVPLLTLARWVYSLRGTVPYAAGVPGAPGSEALASLNLPQVQNLSPQLTQAYDEWVKRYAAIKGKEDTWVSLQSDKAKQRAYLDANPDLLEYFKWNSQFWQDHPDLAKLLGREQKPATTGTSVARGSSTTGGALPRSSSSYRSYSPRSSVLPASGLWETLSGSIERSLLEEIEHYLNLSPDEAAAYAKAHPRLLNWLRHASPTYLAQLKLDYLAYTSKSRPRVTAPRQGTSPIGYHTRTW